MAEIQRVLYVWSKRQLTPLGKITVIKTLAVSKIVLFMNLSDQSAQFLIDFEKMLFTFLWDGKKAKMSKAVVCSAYNEGGLPLLNIHSFFLHL